MSREIKEGLQMPWGIKSKKITEAHHSTIAKEKKFLKATNPKKTDTLSKE